MCWLSPSRMNTCSACQAPTHHLSCPPGLSRPVEASSHFYKKRTAESRDSPFSCFQPSHAALQVTAMSRTLSAASHAALAASDAVAMTAAAYDLAFRPPQPARRPQGSPARQRSPPRRGRGQVPVVALPQHSVGQEQEQETGPERSPEELQQDRLAGILQARLHQLHGRLRFLSKPLRSCWSSCLHPAGRLQLGQAGWDATNAASPVIGSCSASVD